MTPTQSSNGTPTFYKVLLSIAGTLLLLAFTFGSSMVGNHIQRDTEQESRLTKLETIVEIKLYNIEQQQLDIKKQQAELLTLLREHDKKR